MRKEFTMDIQAFAKEVYENAKAHGWWETEPPFEETLALIHSEWSEALEEYRNGRAMVWYHCCEDPHGEMMPCGSKDEYECSMHGKEGLCKYRGKKPEGIAVELIDGCIRILEYLYHIDYNWMQFDEDEDAKNLADKYKKGTPLPLLVCLLHRQTAKAIESPYWLVMAMRYVFVWVRSNGLDPEAIMREKHAYNITRPYRHGGKVC